MSTACLWQIPLHETPVGPTAQLMAPNALVPSSLLLPSMEASFPLCCIGFVIWWVGWSRWGTLCFPPWSTCTPRFAGWDLPAYQLEFAVTVCHSLQVQSCSENCSEFTDGENKTRLLYSLVIENPCPQLPALYILFEILADQEWMFSSVCTVTGKVNIHHVMQDCQASCDGHTRSVWLLHHTRS